MGQAERGGRSEDTRELRKDKRSGVDSQFRNKNPEEKEFNFRIGQKIEESPAEGEEDFHGRGGIEFQSAPLKGGGGWRQRTSPSKDHRHTICKDKPAGRGHGKEKKERTQSAAYLKGREGSRQKIFHGSD